MARVIFRCGSGTGIKKPKMYWCDILGNKEKHVNRIPAALISYKISHHQFVVLVNSTSRKLILPYFESPAIQSTPGNSNLSLTRSNFHFPSDHFLYNFTLDNSNFRLNSNFFLLPLKVRIIGSRLCSFRPVWNQHHEKRDFNHCN